MKKHFLMALVLLMGVSAMAQETETPVQDSHWHSKGNIGLNFSPGAYSNWSGLPSPSPDSLANKSLIL